MSEWIPVSERLPERGAVVEALFASCDSRLVRCRGRHQEQVLWEYEGTTYGGPYFQPTHWRAPMNERDRKEREAGTFVKENYVRAQISDHLWQVTTPCATWYEDASGNCVGKPPALEASSEGA